MYSDSPRQSRRSSSETTERRRIVFIAYPQLVLLDLAGPWEVFHMANWLAPDGAPPYTIELVSAGAGLELQTHSGLPVIAHRTAAHYRSRIDTLMVPAAAARDGVDAALLQPLCRLARRARRVASVCAGAFLLAAAGLLDGRRATTHWKACAELSARYPRIRVEPDAIYVKDGRFYTSAGVTAGIDLALALVEEDLGRQRALEIARYLVMFIRRPGGQTQFSAALAAQLCEREPLRELLAWVAAHPGADLSVERLAARVHMSARNFARTFLRDVGQTPARFVERIRVDAARQRLEETSADLDRIAQACGFGSSNSMRRSFLRVLKVTPSDYRERFRAKRPRRTAAGRK